MNNDIIEAIVEVWLQVVGYESLYSISNIGRVRSEPRLVVRASGSYTTKARILQPSRGLKGKYLLLPLTKEKAAKNEYVHVLVATAFHGQRPHGMEVCHNDGNSLNNCALNLRWATRVENHADKDLHGTSPVGERHPMSKLTDETVAALRNRRKEGATFAMLAKEFEIAPMTAHRAATGKSWSHI